MKVQQVKIKEFKALKDINVEVNGHHLLVMGDNGVGKSSFIQLLEIAMGRQNNLPINAKGEAETTFLHEGKEIKCKVTFKEGKPILKITGQGISIDNNKGAIASLFGAVDFDINEFVELSNSKAGQKKQVEIFKSLLGQEVINELNQYEANIKNSYDERTALGRDLKNLEGAIKASKLGNYPEFELKKIQMVDVTSLVNDIEVANKNNNNYTRIKQALIDKHNEINSLKQRIEVLEGEIEKGNSWLENNKLIDTTELTEKLKNSNEINQQYTEAQTLLSHYSKIEGINENIGELTALIESSKQSINDTIKQMESPVNGLTYNEDTLVYNDVPVSINNLSSSEIIELGILMKLAFNNSGIIFIQRGESIGKKRLEEIYDVAKKLDLQIIMEEVLRGRENITFEIIKENE